MFTRPRVMNSNDKNPINSNRSAATSRQRSAWSRIISRDTSATPQSLNRPGVMQLQRSIGNRAVGQLLNGNTGLTIQPKLTINPPGDKYEQEANRVARQVVDQTSSPGQQTLQRQEEEEIQTKPVISAIQRQGMEEEEMQMKLTDTVQRQEEEEEMQMKPLIQRQGNEDEELMQGKADIQRAGEPEEEEPLQAKSAQQQGATHVSANLETSIQQAKGSGQPLSDNIRTPMEQAFGADFGDVRVHTDGRSDRLNRSVQARAFTTGRDVFFRSGEYNPASRSGKELLAHELTHVVQQNSQNQSGARKITRSTFTPITKIQRQPTYDDNSWKYGIGSLWGKLYPVSWEKADNKLKADITKNYSELTDAIEVVKRLVTKSEEIKVLPKDKRQRLKKFEKILRNYNRSIIYKEAPAVDRELQKSLKSANDFLHEIRNHIMRSKKKEEQETLADQEEAESSSETEEYSTGMASHFGITTSQEKPKEKKSITPTLYKLPPVKKRMEKAIRDIKGEVLRCARDGKFHYNRFHSGYTIGNGPFTSEEKDEIRRMINEQVEDWLSETGLQISNAKVLYGKQGKGSNFNIGAYDSKNEQVLNLHFLW